MPILSIFYGLIIRMYSEADGKHHTPHIHVSYQDKEYEFDFDGNELNGNVMPKTKKKLLDAWLELHQDELSVNWTLLSSGEAPFKIDPLR